MHLPDQPRPGGLSADRERPNRRLGCFGCPAPQVLEDAPQLSRSSIKAMLSIGPVQETVARIWREFTED